MEKWIFLALILCIATTGWAQPQPAVADSAARLTLDTLYYQDFLALNYLEDPADSLTLEDVKGRAFPHFLPKDQPSDLKASVVWGRLIIESDLPVASNWVIRDRSRSDTIQIWFLNEAGEVVKQGLSGDYVRGADRDLVRYNLKATDFSLAPYQRLTVYFRLKSIDHQPLSLQLRITSREYFERIDLTWWIVLLRGYAAVLGFMGLYSLMVFWGTRDATYLYYGLYIFSLCGFVLSSSGAHEWLGAPFFRSALMVVFLNGVGIFYFLFTRQFLNLKASLPRWDRFIQGYVWVRIGIAVMQAAFVLLTLRFWIAIQIEMGLFLLDGILTLALYPRLLRLGQRIHYFFIAGSGVVFVLAMGYLALRTIFAEAGSTEFFILFGAVLVEILIFSLGLGYRVRANERAKLEAERQRRQTQEALNQELSELNAAFDRFVPHEFLQSLGHQSVLDIRLGDSVEKEVTVLFSDIRGYTSLSEQMTPQENFRFLNAYLSRMGPVIQAHEGFVNQYYGDGIMALFMRRPADALAASIQMLRELDTYNQYRQQKNRSPIQIGIGLHTGPLMMGIIGDTLRLEPGVVADTVNTAARMEGLTKFYQSRLLLSGPVHRHLTEDQPTQVRFLGQVQVKGRMQPVDIYECFAAESDDQQQAKLTTWPDFQRGLQAYQSGNFSEALRYFTQVLTRNPADLTAQRYRQRSEHFLQHPPAVGWDGVEALQQK